MALVNFALALSLTSVAWGQTTPWYRGRAGGVSKPALALSAGALFAGLVAAAYATRDSDVGRGITTGAGVLGGATVGAGVGALAGVTIGMLNWSDKPVVPSIIVGALAGAVAGGIATHALSASPSACAPTTGVALVFPYILLLAIPLD
jgi:hypothetical protein